MAVYLLGEMTEEFEDAGIDPLVLPEGLIVAEYVYALAWGGCQPGGILVCGEGILLPVVGGEAKSNVVSELIISEQQR